MSSNSLFSLQTERHVLSGIVKYPDTFFDIDNNHTDNIFYDNMHRTIFNMIRKMILKEGLIKLNNESLDTLLIGQKIKDLGIKFEHDLDITDYIQTFNSIQINKKSIPSLVEELEKLRICRDIYKTGETIIKEIKHVKDKNVEQIIDHVDKIYSENVKLTSSKNDPKRLNSNIIELIEERAKNPLSEIGLMTPYRVFNQKFGGLRPGNIYAFAARPKNNKSTLLVDMAIKGTILNPKCKALILDTEMTTQEVEFRTVSAISQIPMWYLETGNWIKKPEYKNAWAEAKNKIKVDKPVDHLNVSGRPIQELCSLIRRWYHKNIDAENGEQAIIVYDYIKLTGESDADKKEYQLIGDKINTLKELSLELSVPVLTACQLNRDADRGMYDSAAISQSDRLTWFASFVAIFRKKTMEEIALHGPNFGTHIMKPLVYRFEGKESFGHDDFVAVQNEENGNIQYLPNTLNFDIKNFNVEEKGTLKDIVDHQNHIARQGEEPQQPVDL